MSRRTKKRGSTARFGARYGVSVKNRILEIEKMKKGRYQCPRCSKKNVRRISTGIWQCASCHYTFAGAAFTPRSGKMKSLQSRLE
ncbi:MAG: 50S ribosomal protein L37ae [Thermoplasmata archaeon]|nr:50S ribosomal protein L37ae [Thermoplasmata archaeon]RLF71585.1 MAG: 50S ribosomal protein L37ae [Thermoplasmata archaeon]